MTLEQLFQAFSNNPNLPQLIFLGLPALSGLAYFFAKGEAHKSPWPYFYSALVFLSCIPGIFALTLNFYFFLFERQSVMHANIYTQILPILSMFVTLWLIRKNTSFDQIPGFDKIGNLIFMLLIVMSLLWILEKTHIIVFTSLPFYQFVLIFVAGLILIRFGLKRMFG
jgi:multisubunit Na+/H+ antiporter MnhF subunit